MSDAVIIFNEIGSPARDDDFWTEETVLDTAKAVQGALRKLGYRPHLLPVSSDPGRFLQQLKQQNPEFVFNLCEELDDRSELEMCVASLLELVQIPYTGSPPVTLGLALNKCKVKQILLAHGIPTPTYWVFPVHEPGPLEEVRYPAIVKPMSEDASVGIIGASVVHCLQELAAQVQYVHRRFRQAALVEDFIDGRELNVAILGDDGDEVALPISEIVFQELPQGLPRIVNFEAKWVTDSPYYRSTIPVCPAPLKKSLEREIKRMALEVYREIGCRDYARVDFRLASDQSPYVLEVNPNPDLSPQAGLARSAAASGLSYPQLISKIVEFTRERSVSLKNISCAT